MKQYSILLLAAGALLAAQIPAFAQTTSGERQDIPNDNQDSVRTYELGEIVITDTRLPGSQTQPAAVTEVNYRQVRTADATSVAQLRKFIPAAHVQTNSRGETLMYLRDSGERQIAIFLDGVLLNIPWDNRIDLSLIPADIIGQATISKGAHSVLYGANALGGAVNFTTVERTGEGFGGTARLQAGEANSLMASLMHDGRTGNLNYIVFGGYTKSDGFLLPSTTDDSLRYQNGRLLRTNTDMERLSLFGRVEYMFSEQTRLGIAVQHIDAEKGVAPEEHKSKPRFWRYPEWTRSIVMLNANHSFDEKKTLSLRGSAWVDNFGQTIDQYRNVSYSEITSSSIDDDATVGARLSLSWKASHYDVLTFAASGYSSSHTETIRPANTAETVNEYAQALYSTGIEYQGAFDNLRLTLGITLDGVTTPKTGVFPAQDGRNDISAMAGFVYTASKAMDIFASAGRKTRYATPREQFSAALGKFLTNPDLRPESGVLTEVGVKIHLEDVHIQSSIFGNIYTDLIETAKVNDTLEQRVNTGKARVIGWETALSWRVTPELRVEGNYTYVHSRAKTDEGYTRELDYKPEYLGTLSATYRFPLGLSVLAEAVYTGRQMGEGISMASSVSVNARFAYQIVLAGTGTELYVRLNNAFDTYALSQLGLPEAGRTLYGGLSVAF